MTFLKRLSPALLAFVMVFALAFCLASPASAVQGGFVSGPHSSALLTICSSDGTVLQESHLSFSTETGYSLSVNSTGFVITCDCGTCSDSAIVYTYLGSDTFLGISPTADSGTPEYPVGTVTYLGFPFEYIYVFSGPRPPAVAAALEGTDLSGIFTELLAMLPVVMPVAIGYLGIRKGLRFLLAMIGSA